MENVVPIARDENDVPGVHDRAFGKVGRSSKGLTLRGAENVKGSVKRVFGNEIRRKGGGNDEGVGEKRGLGGGGGKQGMRRALGDITNNARNDIGAGLNGRKGKVRNVVDGGSIRRKSNNGAVRESGNREVIIDGKRMVDGEFLGMVSVEELLNDPRIPRDAHGRIEEPEYMPVNYEVKPPDPVIELSKKDLEFIERRERLKKMEQEKGVEELLSHDQPRLLDVEQVGSLPVNIEGVEEDLLDGFDGLDGKKDLDMSYLDEFSFPVEDLGLEGLEI